MKYVIESGVPIPRRAAYPLREMKVGDSFMMDRDKLPNVRSCAFRNGIKIAQRVIDEYTARIWRIS